MKRLISLLAAVTAVVMFALPGFAQSTSYTWDIDCSKVPQVGVGTGVNWYWLHNGVQIFPTDPADFASCATFPPSLSGSGVIPESINGISVSLNVSEYPYPCGGSALVMKSFDPSSPKISIDETVSMPATVNNFGVKEHCSNANASFKFNLGS